MQPGSTHSSAPGAIPSLQICMVLQYVADEITVYSDDMAVSWRPAGARLRRPQPRRLPCPRLARGRALGRWALGLAAALQ